MVTPRTSTADDLRELRRSAEQRDDELRGARAELERALARYTELFDFAPIGYATARPDGTILQLNHAGARIFGRPRAQMEGLRIQSFIAEGDLSIFTSMLERLARTDDEVGCEVQLRCEVQLLCAAGVFRFVQFTATELARGQQDLLLAFEDISERKARDVELALTQELLRAADERKDNFLAALSHELRNPLSPIRNSVDILRAESKDAENDDVLSIIDRQVSHLTRLVDDLLDVTRISRNKITLKREVVDLAQLLRTTLADHRPAFATSGVVLLEHLPTEPIWIDGDPSRIVQVLTNVLTNAEKFTPARGIVEVSLVTAGPAVVLRVRDNGVGIAAEVLSHVFEPFSQAPQSIERSRGGLGLGLAMVHGLVQLHSGTISIASEGPSRGTELTISLPRLPSPNTASDAQSR